MTTKPQSDLAKKVIELVADQLGADLECVTDEARFINDLGADSLDVVELVMMLEERFDLVISDEDAERMQTVGEAIAYVERCSPKPKEKIAEPNRTAALVPERRASYE